MEVSGQLHVPVALPLVEVPLSTHWIGGWVDPRNGLDTVVRMLFYTVCSYSWDV